MSAQYPDSVTPQEMGESVTVNGTSASLTAHVAAGRITVTPAEEALHFNWHIVGGNAVKPDPYGDKTVVIKTRDSGVTPGPGPYAQSDTSFPMGADGDTFAIILAENSARLELEASTALIPSYIQLESA